MKYTVKGIITYEWEIKSEGVNREDAEKKASRLIKEGVEPDSKEISELIVKSVVIAD